MVYLALHKNSPGRRKLLFFKARQASPSHLPCGILQNSSVILWQPAIPLEVSMNILFLLLTWITRELWSETLQTPSLNTISLFCSLGDIPNWLCLERIPLWLFASREGGVRDMVPGDDDELFFFFFFSFGLGGDPRESIYPGSSDRQSLQLLGEIQSNRTNTGPSLCVWVILLSSFVSEIYFWRILCLTACLCYHPTNDLLAFQLTETSNFALKEYVHTEILLDISYSEQAVFSFSLFDLCVPYGQPATALQAASALQLLQPAIFLQGAGLGALNIFSTGIQGRT